MENFLGQHRFFSGKTAQSPLKKHPLSWCFKSGPMNPGQEDYQPYHTAGTPYLHRKGCSTSGLGNNVRSVSRYFSICLTVFYPGNTEHMGGKKWECEQYFYGKVSYQENSFDNLWKKWLLLHENVNFSLKIWKVSPEVYLLQTWLHIKNFTDSIKVLYCHVLI